MLTVSIHYSNKEIRRHHMTPVFNWLTRICIIKFLCNILCVLYRKQRILFSNIDNLVNPNQMPKVVCFQIGKKVMFPSGFWVFYSVATASG